MAVHLPTRRPRHHERPNRPAKSRPPSNALVAVAIGLMVLLASAALIARAPFIGGDDDIATGSSPDTPAATLPTGPTRPPSPDRGSRPVVQPTTSGPSTTIAATTASSAVASTNPPSEVDEPVVWPQSSVEPAFVSPEAAARGFAEIFAGHDDPIYGPYRAVDGRSGEIEIRPTEDGPTTTLIVRQVGPDDSWAVIVALSENLIIDRPAAGDVVIPPMVFTGRARGAEGNAIFELYAHGQREPVATGFVTGRGDGVLGPFTTTVEWLSATQGSGTLLLFTENAEDGQVSDVAAIPLTLGSARPSVEP